MCDGKACPRRSNCQKNLNCYSPVRYADGSLNVVTGIEHCGICLNPKTENKKNKFIDANSLQEEKNKCPAKK